MTKALLNGVVIADAPQDDLIKIGESNILGS